MSPGAGALAMLSSSPLGAPARCLLGRGGHWRRGWGVEGGARAAEGRPEGGGRGTAEAKSERAIGIAVGGPQGGGRGAVV